MTETRDNAWLNSISHYDPNEVGKASINKDIKTSHPFQDENQENFRSNENKIPESVDDPASKTMASKIKHGEAVADLSDEVSGYAFDKTQQQDNDKSQFHSFSGAQGHVGAIGATHKLSEAATDAYNRTKQPAATVYDSHPSKSSGQAANAYDLTRQSAIDAWNKTKASTATALDQSQDKIERTAPDAYGLTKGADTADEMKRSGKQETWDRTQQSGHEVMSSLGSSKLQSQHESMQQEDKSLQLNQAQQPQEEKVEQLQYQQPPQIFASEEQMKSADRWEQQQQQQLNDNSSNSNLAAESKPASTAEYLLEQTKEGVNNAWEQTKAGVAETNEKLKEKSADVLEQAKEGAVHAWEKTKATVADAGEKAAETAEQVKEKAKKSVNKAWKNTKAGVAEANEKIKETAADANETIKEKAKEAFEATKEGVHEVWEKAKELLVPIGGPQQMQQESNSARARDGSWKKTAEGAFAANNETAQGEQDETFSHTRAAAMDAYESTLSGKPFQGDEKGRKVRPQGVVREQPLDAYESTLEGQPLVGAENPDLDEDPGFYAQRQQKQPSKLDELKTGLTQPQGTPEDPSNVDHIDHDHQGLLESLKEGAVDTWSWTKEGVTHTLEKAKEGVVDSYHYINDVAADILGDEPPKQQHADQTAASKEKDKENEKEKDKAHDATKAAEGDEGSSGGGGIWSSLKETLGLGSTHDAEHEHEIAKKERGLKQLLWYARNKYLSRGLEGEIEIRSLVAVFTTCIRCVVTKKDNDDYFNEWKKKDDHDDQGFSPMRHEKDSAEAKEEQQLRAHISQANASAISAMDGILTVLEKRALGYRNSSFKDDVTLSSGLYVTIPIIGLASVSITFAATVQSLLARADVVSASHFAKRAKRAAAQEAARRVQEKEREREKQNTVKATDPIPELADDGLGMVDGNAGHYGGVSY